MKLLAALLAAAGCRDSFAIDQPIDVVPLGAWTTAQNADLEHAAECWNLGFGTDYRFRATSDAQRVEVAFDALECLNTSAWALTTAGFDSRVSVCPTNFEPSGASESVDIGPAALFGVFTHELGHVAGIPVDVDNPYSPAIMGSLWPLLVHPAPPPYTHLMFSTEDYSLFVQYNPDFTGRGACDPIVVSVDGTDANLECACPP